MSSVASAVPDIQVLPCTAEDMDTFVEVWSDAFGPEAPFLGMLFPNHTTVGRADAVARHLRWFNTGQAKFVKAIDRAAGNVVVAVGIWQHTIVGKNERPAELSQMWDVQFIWDGMPTAPEERDREQRWWSHLWRHAMTPRKRAVREAGEKGIMVLEILATKPEHRRKGAGEKIVRWGTDYADGLGIASSLESSKMGAPLYERAGFAAQAGEVPFDITDEDLKDRKRPTIQFMMRQPKPKESS